MGKKAKAAADTEPAAAMPVDDGAAASTAGDVDEDDYERKVRFVSVIANPLASRKLTKRVLKTVRKGTRARPMPVCTLLTPTWAGLQRPRLSRCAAA
jgi:hypothetical protein